MNINKIPQDPEDKDLYPTASALLLIVDPDRDFCATLASHIGQLGYQVKCAFNENEFQTQLKNARPSAILMDLKLYNKDQNVQTIIQNLQTSQAMICPIIFMSDRDDFATRLDAVRHGGAAFLNKTFNIMHLKFVLNSIITLQKNANLKVLVVDDDKVSSEYCAAILERAGIKVSCVNNPMSIFDYIISSEPDVILLDMYMPNIDGLELATIIRQHPMFAAIPIVIMSSETDINKQFKTRSLGADDFILKPFKPNHLIDTILNRIHRSHLTKHLIYTDALTGLMLFPKIKDQISSLMDSCVRYDMDFSIALLDLDYFKQINDKFGHLVGDQMLVEFSSFLLSRIRQSDMVTRYGGEEFAIIFPYTTGDDAIRALNSIREEFSKHVNYADLENFQLTFSAGVASVGKLKDLSSLLAAADQALYKAKATGRNHIELAD